MSCEFGRKLSAYHDGELAATGWATVEEHLRQCAECRGELEGYRRMSAALAEWQGEPAPAELMGRLRGEAERAQQQRGMLHLAEWLTAAAAAVLVVGMISLFYQSPAQAEPSATWERAAVTLRLDAQPNDSDAVVLAQWKASDSPADEDR